MVVRWTSRTRRGRLGLGMGLDGPVLCADLVRPRGSGGGPRDRFIAHLGAIAARDTGRQAPRRQFWEEASRRLAVLALPPGERAAAEIALAGVVPLPPDPDGIGDAMDAAGP